MLNTPIKGLTGLMSNADALRKEVNGRLESKNKAALSQFMTPAATASFMASLFPTPQGDTIRLLDPGAGIGCLTSAFLARLKNLEQIKNIRVDAYEIDETMLCYLEKNLASCTATLQQQRRQLDYDILPNDFILAASERILGRQGLWHAATRQYTHCIMNPPYQKIPAASRHRKALRMAGIETVNLYSGFVALALSLMEPHGYLVAITPRSFCNGPYYRPFRKFILSHAAIRHIHLFDSRSKAFKDDNVLQENVIVMLEKHGTPGEVSVSLSTDDAFSDIQTTPCPMEHIVAADDNDLIIHIPFEEADFMGHSPAISYSLEDIGVQVSTGPVVDFRLKAYLQKNADAGTVPLLYPCHFSAMETNWPLDNKKKPNAIDHNENTKKWLYPTGCYTVVRRFSSKEEKRRIVASVVRPDHFSDYPCLGFENHLNVFHADKQGIPETLAVGLAVFLNSRAVDRHFRRFSGHTQVNAADLRMMKYPCRRVLMELGQWAEKQADLTPEKINKQVETIAHEGH